MSPAAAAFAAAAFRFTWILAPLPDGGGGSNDPELLQALFNAAAGLCKVLAKPITAALPAALKHTKGTLVEVDGTIHGSMSAFDDTAHPLWGQACIAAMVLGGTAQGHTWYASSGKFLGVRHSMCDTQRGTPCATP